MQRTMQMLMQTTAMLCRQQTTTLTMDNNANNDAATQTMGNGTDNDDAATDVNAAMKTTR